MEDIRCLKCGALLVSGYCIQKLCEEIEVEGNFSLAELVATCPDCGSKFGIVVASDSTGLMILYVLPEKAHQCLNDLKQMLQGGLSIAAISQVINNARKPEYIAFL